MIELSLKTANLVITINTVTYVQEDETKFLEIIKYGHIGT